MGQLVYVVIWIIMMCQTDINFPQHCIIPQYGWIFPEVLSHYLSKQWSSAQFIIGPNKWTWCLPQLGKRSAAACFVMNKANLRDLIAATGLVILLKLDLNRPFFSPCDLEIWWMTPKNNRAPLLHYFKLFASFRSHWWIQTGDTVRKRLLWVKIDAFF